jgi:hypothetical protein
MNDFIVEATREDMGHLNIKTKALSIFHPREWSLDYVVLFRVSPNNFQPVGFFFTDASARIFAEAAQKDLDYDRGLADPRLQRLIAELESVEEDVIEDLDGLLHDVFSEQASAINNGGISEQAGALLTESGLEPTCLALQMILDRQRRRLPS